MKKIKVVYVTGTRAEYGLMKNNLLTLKNDPEIELYLIVTGIHLHPDFKSGYDEIKKDGFSIYREIDTRPKTDKFEEVPVYIAETTLGLKKLFEEIKQDFTIILGDRPEALATAITSATMNIPIIHLGGGHISGNIDNPIRYAISKFSHLHLTSSKKCAQRLIRTGEEKWRIHLCSASGVDSIRRYQNKFLNKQDLFKKIGFDSNKKLLVALYHPGDNKKDTKKELFCIIEAIQSLNYQTIFLYSNLDPGGRSINKNLKNIKSPLIKVFKNFEYLNYLSLIKHADILIGNSSSGIIEAPSLKTGFINMGNRERNREFTNNVIHIKKATKEKIILAIKEALSESFQNKLKDCKNPYDNGDTATKLLNLVKSTKINKKLLNKIIPF